ncbi:MAG TPA: hypothetical protein VMO88_02365 [Acidimicrobiales bacterium]|nr:hypothetical protein [Acidimicrobiales bacterium]
MVLYLLVAFDLAAAVSVKHHLRSHEPQNPMFIAAMTTLSRSPSVRVAGTTSINGSLVKLDVVAGEGTGGGSVSIGPAQCDIVLDGPTLYVRASGLTWGQLGYGAEASRLENRWLRTSAYAPPFRAFGEFVNVVSLASLIEEAPRLVGRRATTIDGIAVNPLSAANRSGTTFYVTATGTPVLVAEQQISEFMRLDEYGSARPAGVPTAAIPLSSLLSSQEQ